ncbi:MAG TPA: dTDP-4-dehydrorhamnose reductase [Thermomicrobiaceae bacterium]|nr:dTDP-4-dehydrorhamnose reductase [Thermomicrobiaceae bacterium]
MRVLITGGSGQLGRALARLAPSEHEVVALNSTECDVARRESVFAALERYQPRLIIHAAAWTDVDGCEREPPRAQRINTAGTAHIAAAAREQAAALVYVSTNYVFDGESPEPYTEDAAPRPISVYGASKLAGERVVREATPNHAIVRTAMLYDESGRNFVNTMLRLAAERPNLVGVADQAGNPTYASDLAAAIWRLVDQRAFGTYHLVNAGVASWYEWAVELLRLAGRDTPIEPVPASAFPRAATPPRNGALANHAAAALGITLPGWRDALQRCLERRAALVR